MYKRQPLDGQFDENVVLQTKNGTLDFQPSEPAQPLFGAMRHTPLFPELQITQEYLGRSVSLVYLLPMWRKTFLDFDTYCNGKGSTVSNIIAGKTFPSRMPVSYTHLSVMITLLSMCEVCTTMERAKLS